MENVLPKYKRPIIDTIEPKVDVTYWDTAIDTFDEKKFRSSIIAVINYINPNLLKEKDTTNDIEIIQMQGSAEIHVKITADIFSIKASFLKITDNTNRIALLRKVAEVNFSDMNLAQINLHNDNELWFEYTMPLSVCQPNKVYNLLREICIYADDYDDQFIENYKAVFYKEPKKKALTETEETQVWEQISNVLEDYKNYTAFFKEKRWDDYEWDIIVISLLKISNMPYVHGKLRTDLEEYIKNLFNGDLDFKFRTEKGTNFMKSLLAKTKEDLMSNVYYADQFISLRWRSSEQIIKDWANKRLEMVQKYEKDLSNFDLSYYLQFNFLKLIYDYNLEQNYKNVIDTVLEEVSGLDPTVAVTKLTKVFYTLHDGSINKLNDKKNKGFFSKLFS
ncbi:MAG: YbjN domain-containing protein [Flavobacteriaceae bacterium]|nr:YbjN domain-containing protein [Flavobacteriaceae bacterium]